MKHLIVLLVLITLLGFCFADSITDYVVPSSIPLGQSITVTGLTDLNAGNLCNFYFFDSNYVLVDRATSAAGIFMSQGAWGYASNNVFNNTCTGIKLESGSRIEYVGGHQWTNSLPANINDDYGIYLDGGAQASSAQYLRGTTANSSGLPFTGTKTVRNSAGTGTCTLVYRNGLLISDGGGTC